MSAPVRRSALACALLALSGCTPTIASLVARHRYPEAVCAADRTDAAPELADRTRAALDDALQPSVHVRALSRSELVRAYGEAGARVDAALHVLAVTTRVMPSRLDVSFAVAVPGATTVPVDRVVLAAVIGESLPGYTRVDETSSALGRAVGAVASPFAVLAGIGEVFTTGSTAILRALGFARSAGATTTLPSDDEVRAVAPVTQSLYARLRTGRDDDGSGQLGVLILRSGAVPSSLVITTHYRTDDGDRACALVSQHVVPLGAGSDLATQLRARFGEGLVRVRDLAGAR